MTSFAHCPTNSLPTTTHLSSLIPNQFHKLCPPIHSSSSSTTTPLGQPSCGDGTPFNFFLSRPPQRYSNTAKILLEFQGGGACWDQTTCNLQTDYLTWPEYMDNFVGRSCTEIKYSLSNNNNGQGVSVSNNIEMLCAKTISSTNFNQYNTIIVPYCTQDVHIGDSIQSYRTTNEEYDNAASTTTVRHAGAHNLHSVLQYLFDNFPNPTHIFITGCSAGGTVVPIAYDLISRHYNSFLRGGSSSTFGMKSVDIGVIMDSSVYLTPRVFLEEYYGNWGPETLMKKIGFNFEKYRYESNYPDLLWQHILRRGPNSDKWGFVTHSDDPISLMYYQYMSGDGSNNNGRHLTYPDSNSTNQQINRTLEDNLQSEWWTGIQTSMNAVKKKHPKNVDFYIIDGEGHCSFGLYYPLQDEGFEEWAAPIVKEGRVVGNKRPSAAVFLCSVALGGLLALATLTAMKQKNQSKLLDGEASMNESIGARRMPAAILQIKSVILRQSSRYSSYPWTAAYIFATTLYFVCMLVVQGFAHPLDNPSLGPSAVGLSSFGINNPSLVIYKMEHYRLFTSTFLCSGVLTYLMVMFSMYKHGAALESALLENKHHHWTFPMVAAIISMGANLFYACIGKGASCTSLALAIGLNVFSGVLQRRSAAANLNSLYPSPWVFTIFWSVIGSTPLFPFDSVVAILVSVVIGAALGLLLFDSNKSEQIDTDNYADSSVSVQENESASIRWSFVKGTGAAYCILYLLIVFRVPSPDERNVHPYLTGCNLVYSDQIGEFVEKYANGYNGRMLQGNDDVFDGQNLCAQLCIPHLVHRPLIWGVRKLGLVAVEEGTCEENGYDEHIADKTVREYTITFEVQVFTQSQDE